MKKIILSLILINLFIKQTNAETYKGNTSISLSYNIAPSYSVKIPKTLDLTNNTTSFNYYVKGDIYGNQKLQIIFSPETSISNKYYSFTVTTTQNKKSWTYSELSASYTQYSATLTHQSIHAGDYSGTLNVSMSLS